MNKFLLLWCCLLAWVGTAASLQMNIADALKLDSYDRDMRPMVIKGEPTKINVSLTIHSLIIDEARQMLEVSGDLLQEWRDPYFYFVINSFDTDSIEVPATANSIIRKNVWLPDLQVGKQVFPTQLSAEFLRISKNGHLSWLQRVHMSFPCKLNLKSYPLSTHSCALQLSSVGYSARQMEPAWSGEPAVSYDEAVVSHGYSLSGVQPTSKLIFSRNSAEMTMRHLIVTLKLEPRSGWAVKHTVIPMVATVTTAYLAFFINTRGVCARVIICMLSLVTAAIFHESTYRKVPPAHDTMAIEVFTGTCLAFIFVAAVESVVVDVLGHFPTKGRRATPSTRNSFALEPDLTDDHASHRGQVAAIWLDRCFRVLYPAGFLAFNAVYWVVYN